VAAAATVWLIRHGEVESSYQQVFGGRIDMGLSALGHRQASVLSKYLKERRFDALYASPMQRVQQTLAPLRRNGSLRLNLVPEFREVDFGDWTGLSWKEVHQRFGVSAFSWLEQLESGGIPNCERLSEFRARVEPALLSILDRHSAHNIAIFCHGGVIRMMLSVLLALPIQNMGGFEIDYASITRVSWSPKRAQLELLNFTPWRELGL